MAYRGPVSKPLQIIDCRSSRGRQARLPDQMLPSSPRFLDDSCRPLFPINLLPQVSTNADVYRDLLRPRTRYPYTSSAEDWEAAFRQLDRWKKFRTWQLDNRWQTVGFSAYLDKKRREFERMAAKSMYATVAPPGIVEVIRTPHYLLSQCDISSRHFQGSSVSYLSSSTRL
ncbi:hypothetical protein K458DRAFT_2095 [Lentithecium fluviatile CBS 122367]|uniref:Uncharacterized protein n=1 Tax=Lentithecium fluviatile CBS 122367 TaxID=1168545 RepID=A0A6G1JN48_9PLEO|nr:hypothetical protein K458DRAFT_2095 [Lentithecium fluviatile CBS 122367]